MGYLDNVNDEAVGNGGAGTPEVWDIITSAACSFTGKIVCAFMCLTEDGGQMTAMEEQTTIAHGGKPGVSAAVAAKYLTYTYPQNVIFEGRYTKLVPAAGLSFKIWFLK
jgi:hypothetical protein